MNHYHMPGMAKDRPSPSPTRATAGPTLGLTDKTWNHPPIPNSPRRIHKPLGRKVKTKVAGNV